VTSPSGSWCDGGYGLPPYSTYPSGWSTQSAIYNTCSASNAAIAAALSTGIIIAIVVCVLLFIVLPIVLIILICVCGVAICGANRKQQVVIVQGGQAYYPNQQQQAYANQQLQAYPNQQLQATPDPSQAYPSPDAMSAYKYRSKV
jgi:hypothetical protein